MASMPPVVPSDTSTACRAARVSSLLCPRPGLFDTGARWAGIWLFFVMQTSKSTRERRFSADDIHDIPGRAGPAIKVF